MIHKKPIVTKANSMERTIDDVLVSHERGQWWNQVDGYTKDHSLEQSASPKENEKA